MVTVLITTSGTGSRLGERTKHTNKSLIKLGDMYAICHILKLYPSSTEFIVTTGYFGSHVKQFISLAYPELNVKYVDIDIYEGDGSSLGYSMLKAKDLLQKPFYFHCCDTILPKGFTFAKSNCLYVKKGTDSKTYANILTKDGKVLTMNKKGQYECDYLYIGLAYIESYSEFWSSLQAIYEGDKMNTGLSDVYAIQQMIEDSIPFSFSEVESWCDTGNEESLQKTLEYFPSKYSVLEKYDESLCFFDSSVIKFFSDKKICQMRAERGNHLYPMGPKILGVAENFFSMEMIEGIPVSESKRFDDVKTLLDWAWKSLWSNRDEKESYSKQCENFYKKKTYDRLQKIHFSDTEKLIVNGLFTGSWKDLLAHTPFSELYTNIFSYFHGDFILDNVIKCSDGSFKILDWRQDFDGNLVYGDMYYDLAKLRHNIYFNHMNILQNLYSVNTSEKEVQVEIKCNYTLIQQEKAIETFCNEKNLDYRKVKILTAIIWLNMAPLYEGTLRNFLFYFGKYNLALVLDPPIAIL
jgi:choline kinase